MWCKFKMIGFVLYMILEHKLGESEFGSTIGVIKTLVQAVAEYGCSIAAYMKKGEKK